MNNIETSKIKNEIRTNCIIDIESFSKEELEHFIEEAKKMKEMKKSEKTNLLKNKVIASLFFEPSTRTRLSFETAIQNLGAKIIGFSDAGTSSTKKGETLSDTIKMIEQYADAIVMRHYIEGAAKRATEITKKPIINAGDGTNQHPTQTLLDLFTIKEAFGKINELNIGIIGDLKYGRTVHSLATALDKFENVKLYLISPEQLKFPKDHLNKLKNINYSETNYLEKVLPQLDMLYATRIQKERFVDEEEYEKVKNAFIINKQILDSAKKEFKIMHPLPRVNELSTDLDDTPAALYFKQAGNGLYVREALLNIFLGEKNE